MRVESYKASIATDAQGDATVYTTELNGLLRQIRYLKTDFADGSTITVTNETTGESIWAETGVNASATRAPRQATHTIAGAAALYAGSGVAVLDLIAIANQRLKIVVASGGATRTGTLWFIYG